MFAGRGMRRLLHAAVLYKRYEKCVFSSTVVWVRPKTRLNVSNDAESGLIHNVIIHLYLFDCYTTFHY